MESIEQSSLVVGMNCEQEVANYLESSKPVPIHQVSCDKGEVLSVPCNLTFTREDESSSLATGADPSNEDDYSSPDGSHAFLAESHDDGYRHETDTLQDRYLVTSSIGLASDAEGPRMVIPVTLDKRAASALIDTGATSSLVSSSWLKDNGLLFKRHPKETLLTGFGTGSSLAVIGDVELSFRIHGLPMENFKFLVIESKLLSEVPLVLGEDFLK